jgi:hypothetical protein
MVSIFPSERFPAASRLISIAYGSISIKAEISSMNTLKRKKTGWLWVHNELFPFSNFISIKFTGAIRFNFQVGVLMGLKGDLSSWSLNNLEFLPLTDVFAKRSMIQVNIVALKVHVSIWAMEGALW